MQREVDQVLGCLMPSNRLACQVALHTGLRIGDVLALRTADLKPSYWITEAKTRKRRKIGLPEPLLSQLRRQAGRLWVFEGAWDWRKHRTRQAVWYDIKRAAKAYRLPQNVGTHSMRKVYAVELMHKYHDVQRVQRALNHSNDIVTLIYAMADQRYAAKYGQDR